MFVVVGRYEPNKVGPGKLSTRTLIEIRFFVSNFIHLNQATSTLLNAYWYGCNTPAMDSLIANDENGDRNTRVAASWVAYLQYTIQLTHLVELRIAALDEFIESQKRSLERLLEDAKSLEGLKDRALLDPTGVLEEVLGDVSWTCFQLA